MRTLLELAKSDDVKAVAFAMVQDDKDWSFIPGINGDTDLILVHYGNGEVWIALSTTIALDDAVKLAKVDYSIPGWNLIEGDNSDD